MKPHFILCQALVCLSLPAQEAPVSTTANQGRVPIFEDSSASPEISNFKARLSYEAKADSKLLLSSGHAVSLPKGKHELSLTYENPLAGNFSIEAILDGRKTKIHSSGPQPQKSIKPRLDVDFTIWAKFKTTGQGTIFANCAPSGNPWTVGGKALLVRIQTRLRHWMARGHRWRKIGQ